MIGLGSDKNITHFIFFGTLHCRIFSIQETLHIPYICHFFYTDRIFENQILHPKKRLKSPKTLKMSLKKSYICIFSLILEKFTPDRKTGMSLDDLVMYIVWRNKIHPFGGASMHLWYQKFFHSLCKNWARQSEYDTSRCVSLCCS